MSDTSAPPSEGCPDIGGYATGDGSDASSEPSGITGVFTLDGETIGAISSPTHVAVLLIPEEGGLFSVGGEVHAEGRCKPCAFFHKQGCQNGVSCVFCHHCPPHEKQRRKRLRRRMLRQMLSKTSVRQTPSKSDFDDWSLDTWNRSSADRHVANHEVSGVTHVSLGRSIQGAAQCTLADPGMLLAGPSVLSTSPPTVSPCRDAEDDAAYGAFNQMAYHPGALQYTLVPVPVPVSVPMQQQQLSTQHHTQQHNAEARHSWADLGLNHINGEQYDGTFAWMSGTDMPYMCTVDSLANGMDCPRQGIIEVSAF